MDNKERSMNLALNRVILNPISELKLYAYSCSAYNFRAGTINDEIKTTNACLISIQNVFILFIMLYFTFVYIIYVVVHIYI